MNSGRGTQNCYEDFSFMKSNQNGDIFPILSEYKADQNGNPVGTSTLFPCVQLALMESTHFGMQAIRTW